MNMLKPIDLALNGDLAEPSLANLAFLLRHERRWPRHFRWDFEYSLRPALGCGSAGCALGLGELVWGLHPFLAMLEREGVQFGDNHEAIFMAGAMISENEARKITPAIVAARIEDFLAGRPIRYIRPRRA